MYFEYPTESHSQSVSDFSEQTLVRLAQAILGASGESGCSPTADPCAWRMITAIAREDAAFSEWLSSLERPSDNPTYPIQCETDFYWQRFLTAVLQWNPTLH